MSHPIQVLKRRLLDREEPEKLMGEYVDGLLTREALIVDEDFINHELIEQAVAHTYRHVLGRAPFLETMLRRVDEHSFVHGIVLATPDENVIPPRGGAAERPQDRPRHASSSRSEGSFRSGGYGLGFSTRERFGCVFYFEDVMIGVLAFTVGDGTPTAHFARFSGLLMHAGTTGATGWPAVTDPPSSPSPARPRSPGRRTPHPPPGGWHG